MLYLVNMTTQHYRTGPCNFRELDTKLYSRSEGSLLTARRSDGRTMLDFRGPEKISVMSLFAIQTREIFRPAQQLTEVRLRGKEMLNIQFTG